MHGVKASSRPAPKKAASVIGRESENRARATRSDSSSPPAPLPRGAAYALDGAAIAPAEPVIMATMPPPTGVTPCAVTRNWRVCGG